jgi:hypothetical protein
MGLWPDTDRVCIEKCFPSEFEKEVIMKKVSILVLIFLSIFILSCGDEAASDNDGGVADNETVLDDEVVKDDENTVDESETLDEESETTDEVDIQDETDTDEVADEEVSDETDDSEVPDESQGASEEALTCCQEIVKEWFRCEGSFNFDAVTGCVDCVAALETCDDFNPLDDNFSCKTECNLVCGVVALKGDGSGTDRRLIADEYCKFMMDPKCDLRSTDFSALGAIEGLDACYDL